MSGSACSSALFSSLIFLFSISRVPYVLLERLQLQSLCMNSKVALVVVQSEKQHRERRQSEYAYRDSNDDSLHYGFVIHCLPYSSNFSRSASVVLSA
jgi:hypothetical protein